MFQTLVSYSLRRNEKLYKCKLHKCNFLNCTVKWARRTFVGAAYKVVHDPNIIGKMSGHVEGSRAFNRYRNIDDDVLVETIKEMYG